MRSFCRDNPLPQAKRRGGRDRKLQCLRMLVITFNSKFGEADMNGIIWNSTAGGGPLTIFSPFIALLIAASMLLAAAPAFGHGGKTHAEEKFTALEALEKATELYERLVENGKLEKSWKSDLARAEISLPSKKCECICLICPNGGHGVDKKDAVFAESGVRRAVAV